MKILRKLIWVVVILTVLGVISIYGADKLVEKTAAGRLYNATDSIPYNKIGLLLGTAKTLPCGYINLYYKYRIEAAVELYNAGKIDYILVSGDNSRKDYDEPSAIKNDLIAAGIPADKIYLDYAGFRTLDSVVRCKEIFGQISITVISQPFHNERAIYIADCKGIQAIGFNARDVNENYGFKTRIREKFARVKMVLDLIFGKDPKFLGEKIEIK
ncbi:MAG: vancomycin high temperature exclusion protein [Bacteroidetes bacterium ADurb.Bin408]|nr:MAG: vancomycin high temperature exclusion protein [Bacteroidetes bacterium ADurb.Bin408]